MKLVKWTITIGLVMCFVHMVLGQEAVLSNAYNRKCLSLDGHWKYIVDPYENGFYNYRYEPFEYQSNPGNGAFFTNAKRKSPADLVEYDFDKMDSLIVPGDWNSQDDKLFYYEGTVWYKKSFDYIKSEESNSVILYFGAINYTADVYFNSKKLGRHVGGFTPFQFDVTELLRETDNYLIIKVDNKRAKEGVPTLNTDWWNYGGITRSIKVIELPQTHIADYTIGLADDMSGIHGTIQLQGNSKARQQVQLQIDELDIDTSLITNASGQVDYTIIADDIKYWSPDSPKRYAITLTTDADSIVDTIGFRTITTAGSDIMLNGEPIFLKGISIHEESPIRGGRANTREDAEMLLGWAKELGCNFVRLAHYPHNEHMIRLADEIGLMIWEEIPVYWTIDWTNPDTYNNAENQLSEVLSRDKNRACVIIWSMANETPVSEARNTFLSKLATFIKHKDSTRLISAALEQKNYNGNPLVRTIEDPFAEIVDVLSFNQYIGWYDGNIEKCQTISWHIDQNKPVIISEFGAGAKYGLHGPRDERWTEEYQEYLYQETIQMIDQIDQLRGVSPWLLVDFKSPRRVLPNIQDNYNRKGLISEKGEKKKAFFVLRDYYNSKE